MIHIALPYFWILLWWAVKAIMEINQTVRADMLTILCIMTGINLYNMKNIINGVTTLFRLLRKQVLLPRAEPEVN